jgi:hypothetical protein
MTAAFGRYGAEAVPFRLVTPASADGQSAGAREHWSGGFWAGRGELLGRSPLARTGAWAWTAEHQAPGNAGA